MKDYKQTPVYLNVYDFTELNSCLKICGMPGFHTGVEVNHLQFCYCVVDSNPLVTGVIAIQPQTAQYRFNKKLYLGQTSLSSDEIEKIIDQLSLKYTCGRYHMFSNNCNHFCHQFAQRLVGQGIPKWVFNTTNCLKHVCCCLPKGLVSGLWAIQAIQQQQMRQQANLLHHQEK